MGAEKEQYRAALYCRLSRDDGDKPESDSIVNQQHLLEDFCACRPELTIAAVYRDDGFTGTNFDRPDFRRMAGDIEAGKIDCVIVKDLSRFGRDYIAIGYYLERYFPTKAVRFIAVNDDVDSARGPYDVMLPLKNVFNAQYAKDTSEKVRRSLRAKQSRGEFVGAFPPYGYAKDPENKNRLVIDPAAAEVVRRIFRLGAEGESYREIARTLNREGVPSPIEYKRSMGSRLYVNQRYDGKCRWSDSAVKRVLANETYLGNMVSNRYPSDEMHGKQRLAARGEWIIVKGTHEAVVSRELWAAAQRTPATRDGAACTRAARVGLFSGFLRCGDCGCALSRKGGNSRNYICSAYKGYGGAACSKHAISEDVLTDIVLKDINRVISQTGDIKKIVEKSRIVPGAEQEGKRLKAAIAKVRRSKQNAYEDYREKLITREAYKRCKAEYTKQEQALTRQLKHTADGKTAALAFERPWAERLAELGKLEKLDRTVLEQTVKEIRVFADKRIRITYLLPAL